MIAPLKELADATRKRFLESTDDELIVFTAMHTQNILDAKRYHRLRKAAQVDDTFCALMNALADFEVGEFDKQFDAAMTEIFANENDQ